VSDWPETIPAALDAMPVLESQAATSGAEFIENRRPLEFIKRAAQSVIRILGPLNERDDALDQAA